MLENKIEVNMDTTEYYAETETKRDKNGNDVVILKRIPYAEKENFLNEQANSVLIGDEETGICYVSAFFNLVFNYLYVKYYTNIDVSSIEDVDGYRRLYDYCQREEITMCHACSQQDINVIMEDWQWYKQSIVRRYECAHSLGQKVKTLLDTDVNTTNEETRELIEKLIDMREALKEKEDNQKVFQFAKKKGVSAAPNVGGVKMSFAKKN